MKNSTFKSLPTKKLPKSDREQAVLLGLVELYLKMGKPIGSHTLQENGFESLSSATIRNYLGKMEEQGYLLQPHTSGGRVPTAKAFRLYAKSCQSKGVSEELEELELEELFKTEKKEIATTLNKAVALLSEMTQCAVFASTPRFDQDFIQDIRLVLLDPTKLLSVVITDFGQVKTETIYLDKEVDLPFLKLTEEYFLWRMNKGEKPLFAKDVEAKLSQRIYNEVMVRHVIGYANFPHTDIVKAGLSKLLAYPEFNDTTQLASSLSLLEDESDMQALLKKCTQINDTLTLIGDELCPFVPPDSECAVIAIPYRINQTVAGALALLGPMRIPYQKLYTLLEAFSEHLSDTLTKSVYKYKISFRGPKEVGEKQRIDGALTRSIQIEDKSRRS